MPQERPMIFLAGKVILIDKIVSIDFTEAEPLSHERRVKIRTVDNTTHVITDPTAILHLVQAFVPVQLHGKYLNVISVARN